MAPVRRSTVSHESNPARPTARAMNRTAPPTITGVLDAWGDRTRSRATASIVEVAASNAWRSTVTERSALTRERYSCSTAAIARPLTVSTTTVRARPAPVAKVDSGHTGSSATRKAIVHTTLMVTVSRMSRRRRMPLGTFGAATAKTGAGRQTPRRCRPSLPSPSTELGAVIALTTSISPVGVPLSVAAGPEAALKQC